MKTIQKKAEGGQTFNWRPEVSTGLLGLMTFLAQTNSQDNKQSTINSHLSDNLYNPIATPLGVQTGPLGHFADGGLIPELIASHPVTAPESVYAALAHNPETTASAPSAAPKNAGPLSDDAMFKTYMVHQQGSAGAKALFQSAESGKSWKNFYKGENLDKNMAGNVGKDFYENYNELNPANFLNYWQGKWQRAMSRAAKKPSEYDNLYQEVGQKTGVDPLFLKTVASIESSQNPNSNYNKGTQYKGMFQLNQSEFNQNGGGNIFNPLDNTYAAANNFRKLKQKFKEGGEYQLSDEDIENLKAQGYEFDVIN